MAEIDSELHVKLAKLDRRNLAMIWAVVIWLAGAIFWAGSSYERFQSMDTHLQQIDNKLTVIDDVKAVKQRVDDTMRRLEILEGQNNQRR